MTYKEQLDALRNDILELGFDVAFHFPFPEITNKNFHRLRESYLAAKERLEKYIVKHSSKEPQ